MKKFLSLAASVLAVASFGSAANAVDATGTIDGVAVAAPTVIQSVGMDFATFVTVSGETVKTDGTGSAAIVSGTETPATFNITAAAANTLLNITGDTLASVFPGKTDNVALTKPADVTTDGAGAATFDVNGELSLDGDETGAAAGSYTVTVNY